MLHRAYSVLHVKAVDGQARTITGTATTPTPDRMGDIVEPLGVSFKNPLPLLLYHNSQKPVGTVTFSKPTKAGIDFTATLPLITEPGIVKDRIDEAWQSLNAQPPLIGGVSIGFRSIEDAFIRETGAFHYLQTEVLELSLVVIPANPDATIATVKSLDIGLPASGPAADRPRSSSPGVPGFSRVVTMRTDRPMKKSYADQIAGWEATRKVKTDRMDEILAKGSDTGTTPDAAEQQEHDTLEGEVDEIDKQLVRLRAAEVREKATAKPVVGTDPVAASQSRGAGLQVTIERKLPPGIAFARYAAIVAASKGNVLLAQAMAKERFPDDSQIHTILKTAVAAGTTSASGWASELVPYQVLASDFIEYLRPGNIVDRIKGFDKVPFNVRVGGFSAGTTGYWKGEGKPIPVSKATSTSVSLTWATVGGLVILTQELVRFSTPSAEEKIRNDIARAVNARMDIDFVDPTKASSANVSPASITYGVVATAPTGTTAAKFRADLATMLTAFAAANLNGTKVLILSKSMATQLSLMINTLGNPDFPNMTPEGGSIAGISVIVSEHLTAVGSPSTQTIVLLEPGEVMLADDGQVSVDASSEASIEMLDASLLQDGTNGTGASLVNLWQNGLLGLRAERVVNWVARRSGVAKYISPAAYVVQ